MSKPNRTHVPPRAGLYCIAPVPRCQRSGSIIGRMFSSEVDQQDRRGSRTREGNRVARIDQTTRRMRTWTSITLSAADLTPGLYDRQFPAHLLSMLLPMDIAPEEIIDVPHGAKLVRLRPGGVKLKGDRLPWIEANSGSSCRLDERGVSRNAKRDLVEQCGHKLMRHEIPVAQLNDRRHPCHESKALLCPSFSDLKRFLANINDHVNFSCDYRFWGCGLCPEVTDLLDRNEVRCLVRRRSYLPETFLADHEQHTRFIGLRPFLPQLSHWHRHHFSVRCLFDKAIVGP